ncbi:MAG: adenosylmethionine--8-amino-7-oxononanoate transaminase [Myxococcales bacterium]|nr:adenosylmethionine--8-amino-7-oxononanoate transaminase [Myxococcales bacterium]
MTGPAGARPTKPAAVTTTGAPQGQGLPQLWMPYTQMQTAAPPLQVARAEGVRIVLEDGRELIDAIASWWTACHGYGHPVIREAVQHQLEVMPHVMLGGLSHEPAQRLAARLAAILPGDLDHVFFAESGSVAVEVAMKMAMQYYINRGERGRTRFISFRHGYHGDTLAAMSVCDPEEGMHALFHGALLPQHVIDLPRGAEAVAAFEALLERERTNVAAVIVEPLVQGAGGMKFHAPKDLAALAAACQRQGVLWIADEIMTGFGRTGSLFACEQAGVVPDIITLSKALTGGTLALSATVARRHIFEAFLDADPERALMHGPTFMGNALACAAAHASLDLFEREPRLARVAELGRLLCQGLEPCRGLSGVVDVRVRGAIGVVQLEAPAPSAFFTPRALERGVWLRPFGDIVYTTPPFTISDAELGRICETIVAVTVQWSEQARG